MSQDQRLQQVLSVLREKASQFDANKEKSMRQILCSVKELRDLIKTVEEGLLNKVEIIFGSNPFAAALADVNNYNGSTSVDYNKLERVSREPVPPATGPSNDDFLVAKKAIFELKNFDRKQREVPQKMTGRAVSFDTIELSWGSVPGAVAYQVEGRKPSDSVFGKAYEGNYLSYTVAGLEPGTRYLFHLRAVFGDGSVSEWSREIKVATQKVPVPVPSNITANALSRDTVSVSWNPVHEEGVSYRVWVKEENTGSAPRSCVVDCGQNT